MKKFIILLSFLFIGLVVNAKIDTTNIVTNTNAEKLADKYINEIESGIIALAVSLKQPAEHVYTILIKQQYVKSWTYIILNLLLLVLSVIFWIFALKNDFDDEGYLVISLLSTASLIVCIACTITPIITGFLNPEYGAIKTIINAFSCGCN
jgi:ABC-type uncharacterized transport system permease subunit